MADRPQLRRLVAARVAGLDQAVREVVTAASVLGERIDPAVLAAMTGTGSVDAELERARAAGVLRDADGLAFEHALVRDAVYAELGTEQRIELHSRAAAALEDQRASRRPRRSPTPLAPGRRAGEVPALGAAGRRGSARGAGARRCGPLRGAGRGVRTRHRRWPTTSSRRLLIRLAEAVDLDGFAEPAARLCVEAAELAESAGRPDLLAAAGLVIHGSGDRAVLKQIVPICTRALELLAAGRTCLAVAAACAVRGRRGRDRRRPARGRAGCRGVGTRPNCPATPARSSKRSRPAISRSPCRTRSPSGSSWAVERSSSGGPRIDRWRRCGATSGG